MIARATVTAPEIIGLPVGGAWFSPRPWCGSDGGARGREASNLRGGGSSNIGIRERAVGPGQGGRSITTRDQRTECRQAGNAVSRTGGRGNGVPTVGHVVHCRATERRQRAVTSIADAKA